MRSTLQQIAQQAGVSRMTVSLALRARPQIPAATRERIRKIASELGYQPDPTFNLLMAHIRSKAPAKYQATLAVASFVPLGPKSGFRGTCLGGIEQQAARRGYSVDFLPLLDANRTPEKTLRILQSRGVKGLILWGAGSLFLPPAFHDLYTQFPCVVAGSKPRMPALHFVTGDSYAAARMAFGQALKAGYRRPGVLLNVMYDQMEERRHRACFLAEQLLLPPEDRVPMLEVQNVPAMIPQITAWRERHRPDCLISGFREAAQHLRAAGLRIPGDIGYIAMDREPDMAGTAGVDPNRVAIGAASVDLLISLLHANECGVPPIQLSTLVEGTWVADVSLPNRRDAQAENIPLPSRSDPYPSLGRARGRHALPLDLRKAANRRRAAFCGFGAPLLFLEPGRKQIHDIPFDIIDEDSGAAAAIAIGATGIDSSGQPTASKVFLPVGHHAAAVYFLHACLHARTHHPVARYELIYENGSHVTTEIVVLGPGPLTESEPARRAASNVQDWWPDYPPLESGDARCVIIASPDEPDLYSRCLYTFQWINPHPARKIRSLKIMALPDSSATLVVLAVTTIAKSG